MITTGIPVLKQGVSVYFPLGLAVVVVVAAEVAILPSWWVVFLLAAALWSMLPGVVAIRRLYRDIPHHAGLAWLLGAPVGYLMSTLLLLGARFLGFRSIWGAVLCPAVALVIARLLPSLGPGLRVPRFDRRDLVPVVVLAILAVAVVLPSFRHVGAELPDGRAYRAYFTADFVWSMAVVGELSKSEALPENPFLAGEAMHYYWLDYLLPALEHRSLGSHLRLDRMLLVNHLLLGIMFMMFFYGLTRHVTPSRAAAAIGCVFALLFTSLEGLFFLFRLLSRGQPFGLIRYVNVDALSRWILQSLPVDGLQRMLLYQPQHQLGYALGFFCLLVIVHQWRRPRIAAAAFAGVLLAGGFLVSPVSALLLGTITAVVGGLSILRNRAWRVGFWSVAAAAVPIGFALALALLLHYTSQGASVLKFGLNPLASQNSFLALAVSIGPIVLAALPGAWLLGKHARGERVIWPTVALVISLLFYFFVDVRDHKFVYVGWRAGHIIFITLAGVVGVGVYFLVLRRKGSKAGGRHSARRIAWAAYFIAAALVAAPTIAIDLYNTQDIHNRAKFKKGHWTLVLTHEELKALDWLRRSTPPDARVQIEPYCRDPATWAYLPAFAERRMAAGIPLSMVPLAPYLEASERVREIYLSTNPRFIDKQARKLGIDYLVVGINERRAYPRLETTLNSRPNTFPRVFSNNAVTVYALSRRAKTLIKWFH
jgi:hypothetical protein